MVELIVVCGLAAAAGVVASDAGVDDLVAMVEVVFVAAADDDRVRPIGC